MSLRISNRQLTIAIVTIKEGIVLVLIVEHVKLCSTVDKSQLKRTKRLSVEKTITQVWGVIECLEPHPELESYLYRTLAVCELYHASLVTSPN
jgi:hypothetical protein